MKLLSPISVRNSYFFLDTFKIYESKDIYIILQELYDRGLITGRRREGMFSSPQLLRRLWLTRPPIKSVPRAPPPGIKRPVLQADHPPSSSAEVKNAWSHTSTSSVCLHGVGLN
jgi:hypothetical protein